MRLSFVAQALEMLHEAARLDDPDATFNLAQVRATATTARRGVVGRRARHASQSNWMHACVQS